MALVPKEAYRNPKPSHPVTSGLPPELHSHIFSFVSDRHDLHQLCLTSHAFYHEAIPLLYHSVDLTVGLRNGLDLIQLTLTRNPKLGLHVRELTLSLYGPGGPAFNMALTQMLSVLDELRVLTIADTLREPMAFEKLVGASRFRLDAFHNKCLGFDEIRNFLKLQPTIRRLTHCVQISPLDLGPISVCQMLPNLTILDADVELLGYFEEPHPMKEIYLHYIDRGSGWENSTLANLKFFRETLLTLSLDREYCATDVISSGVIDFIAEQVPNLNTLSILDGYPSIARNPDAAFDVLLNGLSRFKMLRTFEYSPTRAETESFWWKICSRGPKQVAAKLFSSNPTLRVVTFPNTLAEPGMEGSIISAIRYSKSPWGDIEEAAAGLKFYW
ncbi:hypothetical protein JAAARDRAFT_209774 [Jaapia argillacea MUCL 33604]|uniref:F-box domain-containing protein n=1 Tax=Jaapia argillacea MUCL 33604 TaxID=933084 RepID=A0A067PIR5_9AGAM|nr:hypothetical protein JAAARDRAFT_209774 [Jaapia argillacea MUCL 33604]